MYHIFLTWHKTNKKYRVDTKNALSCCHQLCMAQVVVLNDVKGVLSMKSFILFTILS